MFRALAIRWSCSVSQLCGSTIAQPPATPSTACNWGEREGFVEDIRVAIDSYGPWTRVHRGSGNATWGGFAAAYRNLDQSTLSSCGPLFEWPLIPS